MHTERYGQSCYSLLDLDRRRRRQPDGDDRPAGKRRRVAVAGHDGRGAAGRAGRAADDRALAAAEDRAEHRAADRGAADLARAFVGRAIAVAVDRLGAQRHLAAVGQHQRVEADAEPGAFLHFAAALDERDGPDHARAGRDRHASVGDRRRA